MNSVKESEPEELGLLCIIISIFSLIGSGVLFGNQGFGIMCFVIAIAIGLYVYEQSRRS
jgi:hypothetical protein